MPTLLSTKRTLCFHHSELKGIEIFVLFPREIDALVSTSTRGDVSLSFPAQWNPSASDDKNMEGTLRDFAGLPIILI
jgi:hypothetical protein